MTVSFDQPVDHILESDHKELDELLAKAAGSVRSADLNAAYHDVDRFWARLAMHIRAEHLRLFPFVRTAAETDLHDHEMPAILEGLRVDHDFFMRELARAIKALRLVFDFGNAEETFALVGHILSEVRERLDEHNRVEETIVYPVATEKFLSPADLADLTSSVKKELDNYPQRFKEDN